MPTINVTDKNLSFEIFGGCKDFFNCRDHQVILYGGTGTGKTYTCCWKMLLLCMKYPGCKFLFTRNSYTSLVNTGIATFEKVVKDSGWTIGKKPGQIKKAGESKPTSYEFPFASRWDVDTEGKPKLYEGKSTITVASLDNAKDQLGGEYDYIYVNQPEQSSEEDWQYICSRADGRNNCSPYPQIFGDPNPEAPQHWIKKYGWEEKEGQVKEDGRWRIIKSTYHDNPTIWNLNAKGVCPWTGISGAFTKRGEDQIGRALQSYGSIMQARLVRGEWAAFENLVYAENWNRQEHIISTYMLNKQYPDWQTWDSYWAIDFGFDDPFVWMEFRKHPTQELYINTKTIYMSQRTILDHAEQIQSLTIGSPRPTLIVADRNPQEIMLLQQSLGYNIISAKKGPDSIKARINILTDMLKNHQLLFLDDAVVERDMRLVEKKRPIGFIEEVEMIRWRDNSRLVNDMPMGGDDHCENAAGYLFAHIKADDRKISAIWI